MGGCLQKVNYGDSQEVETTTIEFGSTDLQKIAVDMTDSMLNSSKIAEIIRDNHPILFVESIKNKTAEHIDTESITDSISTRLLQSKKFRFVDMTRMDAVHDQLNFQKNSILVNNSTATQFGEMVSAQYMLYGNLSSINKRTSNDENVYYKMTMRLIDLESGMIEWADETEIRKKQSKSLFGW
ncbi:Lipoprotein YcfM, part of a salvage pathway of unknown substrate [Candidatus Enterovibrio altilux]|uniref:Penicillin-binding protein activator LpoB n=2 Tax=Candidatus Enterovibrio altilux TaxID=1927128 RepID=A0A291B6G2_9GAMM|nr:Lipoprotein YcfM, part of a salvage pathway of unknown substrate [Candidatus Enterovibrio luxaltus]